MIFVGEKELKAYYQGEVDYFCAIYAIINSIRLAMRRYRHFTFKEGCAFYQHMIQYLFDTNQFLEVLYHGTSLQLMDELLNVAGKYLLNNYNLKLFHKRPLKYRDMPIKDVSSYIGHYVAREGNSCIMRLHNKDVGDHWSVIRKKAFSSKLRLFDSYFYPGIDVQQATWECYANDGLCHIAREGLIFIKVKRVAE